MKAVVLSEFGGPEQLQVREVSEAKVGAGAIKVRVSAASINPIDWKLRSGMLKAYMPLELPAILGRDAAGTVVEVGDGITSFKRGDKVLGRVNEAYAELVVAAAEAWAPVPPQMDLADAGALPLVLLTGAQLADAAAEDGAGQVVLVTGALGSVGRVALFVLKSRGAKVYAGVRASQIDVAAAHLRADGVVALDDDGQLAALPPLDAIADTVGGAVTQKLLAQVKPGGVIGSVVGEPAGAKARGLVVRAFMAHADSKRLGELAQAVADGKLTIPITKRFPMAEAAAAHALAEKGAGGKVLLIP